jgi:hypothetical protein
MRLLRERRGPRAHAQLIGGEVTLLDPEDHAEALAIMRAHGREPMSVSHGDVDYGYLERLRLGAGRPPQAAPGVICRPLWLADVRPPRQPPAGRRGVAQPLPGAVHGHVRAATPRAQGPVFPGRFSVAALVIGMAVHMTMAMLSGTLGAVAAFRLPGARSLVIAAGVLFTALLWAGDAVRDLAGHRRDGRRGLHAMVFAVAHLLFGMMAASWAALAIEDADPRRPRHALPRQSAGPRNWCS